MGYSITPYRVSLERLCSYFGIEDKGKRSKIRAMCRKKADNIDELAYGKAVPKFMDVVEELLDGKATHAQAGYVYWYAIEGFIEELGQVMYANDWIHASEEAQIFWDYEDFGVYDIDAPMEIPTPDDFPTVFVLHNAMMTDELVNALVQEVTDSYQIAQLENWIKEAKRYKQDLVLYYY